MYARHELHRNGFTQHVLNTNFVQLLYVHRDYGLLSRLTVESITCKIARYGASYGFNC